MWLSLIQRMRQEARTGQHGLRSSHHALWMYPSDMDMWTVVLMFLCALSVKSLVLFKLLANPTAQTLHLQIKGPVYKVQVPENKNCHVS